METQELILFFISLLFTQLSGYLYGKIKWSDFFQSYKPAGILGTLYVLLGEASLIFPLGILVSGFFFFKWYIILAMFVFISLIASFVIVKTRFSFTYIFTLILCPLGIILYIIFFIKNFI